MYYEVRSDGTPLLLLRGFSGCTQNWHPFANELSAQYRLIVVDLRGHGHSTNPNNRFRNREAANDVYLLVDRLGIRRFSAMGISSGGMTLLHMATRQPERIDSMVLISATTHFPDQAGAIMHGASFDTCLTKHRKCIERAQNAETNRFTDSTKISTDCMQTTTT